ncbi:MAG: plasmid pRiA4b ORF-3 family protein [Acidiferrobacterales bacterium]
MRITAVWERADASADSSDIRRCLPPASHMGIVYMVKRIVYQFKITLGGIEPPIWRRIQVPEAYSFWDLHVAIQDSMGWLDSHLHAFRFGKARSKTRLEIGIPLDEGFETERTVPGWKVPIVEHFGVIGTTCEYEYDFGDGWVHEVSLEGRLLRESGRRYPRCLEGARACPPEDCGGVPGYYRLLEIMSDPSDEEYEDMVTWIGDRYHSESFDPEEVKFDNPKRRLKNAFTDRR